MITIRDINKFTPQQREQLLEDIEATRGQGSPFERAEMLEIYFSKKPDSPAAYLINNADSLHDAGEPETRAALIAGEISWSWIPCGFPREMQLEALERIANGEYQNAICDEMKGRLEGGEDGDLDDSLHAGFLARDAIRELPMFLDPDNYIKAVEFNWEMLGHPDFPLPDIRIDRLPRAEVVVREGIAESTAYILRTILQNGKDINGFDIREDCTLDHIDPASKGYELSFGNMQPMMRRLNSRKNDRSLADYLDSEVAAGRMTQQRRDDLVELDEARKKDATAFMDWWLTQHQQAYDNRVSANGGDGKYNDTQHPEPLAETQVS